LKQLPQNVKRGITVKRSLLAVFALVLLIGWLLRPVGGVPILAYHRVNEDEERYSVSPQQFSEQMQFLQQHGYTAISMAEMADAFSGGRKLPPKPIVITFDDGYSDNLVTALPILEKYGMKATIFIIAGSVGQPDYLSWEQAAELLRRGAEIGSHTVSHADLSQVNDAQKREEILQSKVLLDSQLSKPVEFLAYPFGQFDPSLFPLLQQAGYRGACTGIAGLNFAGDPPYRWKRVNVPRPKLGMLEFRLRLLRAQLISWR
jgi:peptidoglycan/xylan/chitin deacetylase (PgdA/CDA1 family)